MTNDAHRANAVSALRFLAKRDTSDALQDRQPPVVSAFVSRRQVKADQLVVSATGLVVVIEGRKKVVDGVDHRAYGAGDAFVLPENARVDVVNTPDAGTGFYRALFIGFTRDLVIKAARLWPQFVGQKRRDKLIANADLCAAIVHAAQALSRRNAVSQRLIDHRILEILLILAEQGVLPLIPKYADGSVVEAVRLLVRHRLHHPWTAADVAAELSMSQATLRRRLRAQAQTLQGLLRAERMRAAHILLADRNADVADALAATGYRSRSHFARHFQEAFGASPSAVRRQRETPVV